MLTRKGQKRKRTVKSVFRDGRGVGIQVAQDPVDHGVMLSLPYKNGY